MDKNMEYCFFCESNIDEASACEPELVLIGEDTYDQIRYGKETWTSLAKNNHSCPGCNVVANEPHHPGCDIEQCPKCSKQIISCGCLEEE